MEYDLNQIADPTKFQRLMNAILTARFGEDARLTPLRGPDGGSDGETAPDNPNMEFRPTTNRSAPSNPIVASPDPGRYIFQAKYHQTGAQRTSDLRSQVLREFESELTTSVLNRPDRQDVDYFFVVTNIMASKNAIERVDHIRSRLLREHRRLHADVWWGEKVVAFLDWSPELWLAFPEIFPGGVPPLLAQTMIAHRDGISRSFRIAASHEYERDLTVKFRQIELEHKLFDLFVDLDVRLHPHEDDRYRLIHRATFDNRSQPDAQIGRHSFVRLPSTALELLIDDSTSLRRIVLEGGPGQGKSTITQMAAQMYRTLLLRHTPVSARHTRWRQLCKVRFPFRVELRRFAEWISGTEQGTLEQYIAVMVGRDSGGTTVTVEDVHAVVSRSSVILLLDGLDEIGGDRLRDRVLDSIMESVNRFETALNADLRVVLTTRPPALTGRRDRLEGFTRTVLSPMESGRIDDYLSRWLAAQITTTEERERIKGSFDGRRDDPHVEALARNPMQLSVLLQFIHLKGDAFPDRRAELYRDYFRIVIDRDVEKSPELRTNRDLIEGLHAFLGFHFHGATELNQSKRTLNREDIIELSGDWLRSEGHSDKVAGQFFALGEERFGLIVAVAGEGDQTTYGFEVQPIQEYFAASYISNHLKADDAHGIFELLVHREYWREVALFLAGLRRPNEKADLVARAKAADQDAELGWTQNGRAIILQLLREGVLHQPRHVLAEAMDFISDLLDMSVLRLQRDPEGLVETVCQVARLYPTDSLSDRVVSLLTNSSHLTDEGELSVIHRLGSRLLSESAYTDAVLTFSSTKPRHLSLVRLSCPYGAITNLGQLASTSEYWAEIPLPTLARQFWRSALHHGFVIDTEYPPNMNSHLVVEFATDYSMAHGKGTRIIEIRGQRPPAIWKLQQNLQLMRLYAQANYDVTTHGHSQSNTSVTVSKLHVPRAELSYSGIPAELKSCISDLISASDDLLTSIGSEDHPKTQENIGRYVMVIKNHLMDSGISGWVACRCASEHLHSMVPFGLGRGVVEDFIEPLREFYPMDHISSSYRRKMSQLWPSMPLAVRLRRGSNPVPLYQIVADYLDGSQDEKARQSIPWITDIPLPTMIVRRLTELCRSDLPRLLRFLGGRTIVGFPYQPRLMVQDTRRVLKTCRGSGDESLLQGAATVLLNASISGVAEAELIVKILSAAPSSHLVDRVLGTGEYSGDEDSETRHKRLKLSRAVTQMILTESQKYPFRVVSKAVNFVAGMEASENVPLFQERPDLKRSGS